jgi:hypothetical protein
VGVALDEEHAERAVPTVSRTMSTVTANGGNGDGS